MISLFDVSFSSAHPREFACALVHDAQQSPSLECAAAIRRRQMDRGNVLCIVVVAREFSWPGPAGKFNKSFRDQSRKNIYRFRRPSHIREVDE